MPLNLRQSTFLNVAQLFRDASLIRLRQHSSLANLEVRELENKNDLVLGHWLAMILISSENLKVTFQAHYQLSNAQKLSAPVLKQKHQDISAEKSADFVREFCNLTAGSVKNTLNNSQIDVGVTLPMVSRGFDHIFFTTQNDPNKAKDFWCLQNDDAKIICSIITTLKDETPFANFKWENLTPDAAEGEIEFL